MLTGMDVRVVDDPARVAAEMIARRLRDAVRRRGSATIAFSGGSTTPPMLAVLATLDVPWSAVEVFQVDERVAPDGDPDRNAGQLAVLPLTGVRPPGGPGDVGPGDVGQGDVGQGDVGQGDVGQGRTAVLRAMPVTATDLDAAAARYAASLPERFDVVHLGMGDDGHTASWPPGDPVIDSPLAVDVSGEFNGRIRMTLTPGAVNRARMRLVLVSGAGKAPMVERWLAGDTTIPVPIPIPIQRVRRTDTVVVLDRAAGGPVVLDGAAGGQPADG
jgi:6-phosphogluconolactonase/glucosamine-6-phosphate isomerase/deaminase